MKNDADDAAEVGDLTLTIPEISWDRFEDELARTKVGGSRRRLLIASDSVHFSLSRDLSHLLWDNRQSSELHHLRKMLDQLAPRVAKSVNASLAVSPKMSVAALLAAPFVPSDAVFAGRLVLSEPRRTTESSDSRRTGFSSRQGVRRPARKELPSRYVESYVWVEAQAALNNISQPQVPEQVDRDGLESPLELAIFGGTVDPMSALGQKFTRSWGPDEKEAIEHDGAFCWIGYSVVDFLAHRTYPETHRSNQSNSLRSA